jgi:hypothetical protein
MGELASIWLDFQDHQMWLVILAQMQGKKQ